MNSITLKSPAKLNLHLRILRKRPDGYHDLLTLFQRISLCDTIHIKKIDKGFKLTTNKRGLETREGNLITKAYRELQKRFRGLDGVSVRLNKKIPLGAGLGGGSSNAAFFLLGMKKLFKLKISQSELLKIGGRLGADIPFFLSEAPQAMAWGVGEKLEKLRCRGKLWFLLLLTEQGLNTKKVYQNLTPPRKPLSLTKEKGIAKILCSFLSAKRIRDAACLARNDLEPSAFSLRPSIPKAIINLKTLGVPLALMSGSGPTVFCVFSSRKEAVRFAKRFTTKSASYRKMISYSF